MTHHFDQEYYDKKKKNDASILKFVGALTDSSTVKLEVDPKILADAKKAATTAK